mmetsp:Transcript_28066/g.71124  ORF Transcript_28066/g.71124 Transcript_28066/m.71124 type:complete len:223 (+) Transcript_28066:274-942(+)
MRSSTTDDPHSLSRIRPSLAARLPSNVFGAKVYSWSRFSASCSARSMRRPSRVCDRWNGFGTVTPPHRFSSRPFGFSPQATSWASRSSSAFFFAASFISRNLLSPLTIIGPCGFGGLVPLFGWKVQFLFSSASNSSFFFSISISFRLLVSAIVFSSSSFLSCAYRELLCVFVFGRTSGLNEYTFLNSCSFRCSCSTNVFWRLSASLKSLSWTGCASTDTELA